MLDDTLKLPLAKTYFHITLKGGYSNLRNASLTDLFAFLLEDELTEIVYQATVAKLEVSISLCHDKLLLEVYGLIDMHEVILSEVLAVVKSFLPKDDRFRVIKKDLERTLKNIKVDPLDHCTYSMERVLYKNFRSVEEKLRMLTDLSLADLETFIPDLLSQLCIEGHCHGNLLKKEALDISDIFKSHFSVPPVPIEMRHKEPILCLPSRADLVRDVRVKNKKRNKLSSKGNLKMHLLSGTEPGCYVSGDKKFRKLRL